MLHQTVTVTVSWGVINNTFEIQCWVYNYFKIGLSQLCSRRTRVLYTELILQIKVSSKMSPKKKQVKPIKRENREKERMTKSRKGEKKTRKGRKVSERVKT